MEDLSLIASLIASHPVIAAAIAFYLLFFRGGSTPSPGGGGFSSILLYVLKFLLARLEPQPPTDPSTPPSTPAPFDFTEFLKRLFDEFLKARNAGDKEHEEAVLKVMKKCENCTE